KGPNASKFTGGGTGRASNEAAGMNDDELVDQAAQDHVLGEPQVAEFDDAVMSVACAAGVEDDRAALDLARDIVQFDAEGELHRLALGAQVCVRTDQGAGRTEVLDGGDYRIAGLLRGNAGFDLHAHARGLADDVALYALRERQMHV